ncbi:MAG: M6 family metalloprotease domain-containing protein [Pseudomonadales bacterium]|nr:M6 family metalloprotease domain-containing protein [Pseudomonadales bacterium]
MRVVFYFCKNISILFVLSLSVLSLHTIASSVGIQNGQLIIGPPNELQNPLNQLSARSIKLELSTKEFVGVIDQPTLVVLISFADQKISTELSEWENRIFKNEFSVKTFFENNSLGSFQVVPATTTGIIEIELDINHPDFGSQYAKSTELANQALIEVAKQIDLSDFDTNQNKIIEIRELAFVFVGAGFEKSFGGDNASHPNIWGHQSSSYLLAEDYRISGYVLFGEKHGSKQASIGIICHELGHLYFNLPDLYDRDGSSAGAGNWGVMSYGTWGSSGNQMGDRPVNMLAWSRQKIGFVELADPEESKIITTDAPVKISTDNPSEYFIVEYR